MGDIRDRIYSHMSGLLVRNTHSTGLDKVYAYRPYHPIGCVEPLGMLGFQFEISAQLVTTRQQRVIPSVDIYLIFGNYSALPRQASYFLVGEIIRGAPSNASPNVLKTLSPLKLI